MDLDGTLLRSDLLLECAWSALARDAKAAVRSVTQVRGGPAAFKRALVSHANLDIATLPFNADVLARVADWRAEGGRTVLATASDQMLAEEIAKHLNLFDEVYGSDGIRNFKGPLKAAFLRERFPQGFTYIGDSRADLAVWKHADKAISVGASRRVVAALDAAPTPAEHLPRENRWPAFKDAIRPQQWVKNLLVIVPYVASPEIGFEAFFPVLCAFVAMSLAASAGYLINDLLDLADDRSHPRKRERAFASGALSPALGTLAIPILLALSCAASLLVTPGLLGAVLIYFVATLAYSIKLKRHTLIDICMLAFLFTLRIIAGGLAIATEPSVWLLAFSMFIFFSLAAVKRLAELTDSASVGRKTSRRGYIAEDRRIISQMAITSGFLAVLVLALYVDEPTTQEKFASPWLLWSICPLLLFWVGRMVLKADRGEMDDDPLVFAVSNRTSGLTIILCGLLVVAAFIP